MGQHETFDRAVFEFRDGLRGMARGSYSGPNTLTPGLPTAAEVKYLGAFEGVAHAGIGLSVEPQVGFRVRELQDPARLVIDVAHTE